jgi:cytochrome P450
MAKDAGRVERHGGAPRAIASRQARAGAMQPARHPEGQAMSSTADATRDTSGHGGRGAPVSDFDPFSIAFFDDPHSVHEQLREAGPVVWLSRYGCWAAARYAEVHAILNDWQTFCSSRGVGMSDFAKETPWRPKSLVLETDPPEHDRARAVLNRVLSRRR